MITEVITVNTSVAWQQFGAIFSHLNINLSVQIMSGRRPICSDQFAVIGGGSSGDQMTVFLVVAVFLIAFGVVVMVVVTLMTI